MLISHNKNKNRTHIRRTHKLRIIERDKKQRKTNLMAILTELVSSSVDRIHYLLRAARIKKKERHHWKCMITRWFMFGKEFISLGAN